MTFVFGILSESIRNLAKTQGLQKMPADHKLELVAEVDADKANASIKSVSTAFRCARGGGDRRSAGTGAAVFQRRVRAVRQWRAGRRASRFSALVGQAPGLRRPLSPPASNPSRVVSANAALRARPARGTQGPPTQD